jgi:succinate dehydrogenase/fumarate reductase-like Fe-S protein
MNLTLKVWRQADAEAKGEMKTYQIDKVSPDMSFLEMMDVLNEQLWQKELILSLLTMTVAKVFVECVRCS